MADDFDLIDVIAIISATTILIIDGKQDTIYFTPSQQLLAKAKQAKVLLSYDGGHIATFSDVDNQQLMLQFMQKYQNHN